MPRLRESGRPARTETVWYGTREHLSRGATTPGAFVRFDRAHCSPPRGTPFPGRVARFRSTEWTLPAPSRRFPRIAFSLRAASCGILGGEPPSLLLAKATSSPRVQTAPADHRSLRPKLLRV